MFFSILMIHLAILHVGIAAPSADLVDVIPGFEKTSFPVYSGYLHVPGPIESTGGEPYDSLAIHYQLNGRRNSRALSANSPVVAWHQGGPGGSSTQGGMIEMSWFQVDSNGTHTNPNSWNAYANMLYLESPAGSGQSSGFSTCSRGGAIVGCSWDDVTQAAAYARTLVAFYAAFPELAHADLYLAGESYFGQYGPNIAHYIVSTAPFNATLPLKGLLVGNGCWGGDATHVNCNGPNEQQNDVDTLFGKNLVSKKLYTEVYKACEFPKLSLACEALLELASVAAGPHNVYDVYDNCPETGAYLERAGNKSMRWLLAQERAKLNRGVRSAAGALESGEGGYTWSCGDTYPPGAVAPWFLREDVQAALHLDAPGRSKFDYKTSGPASVLLYPALIARLRVLIYNGDADTCVPFKGNEEWIDGFAAAGTVAEKEAWRPWFLDDLKSMPVGYVTTYAVPAAASKDHVLTFATIRLAGHMVPMFQPAPASAFFKRFLANEPL
jgi:hypothetical protein